MGGTKKKVRPKSSSKSPSKEYFQIWNASTSPSPEAEVKDLENASRVDFPGETSAPPLPPRAVHRPLERSHALSASFTPPVVHRQNKPKKIQKLEDTFGFELIDTDEDYKSFSTASTGSSLSDADVASTPSHKMKAALLENGKKLIGCDNYITTVLSKTKVLDNSSPQTNAHLALENRDSQSSVSTQSSGSADVVDGEVNNDLANKPHKPLTRQVPDGEATEVQAGELPQTPLLRPKIELKNVARPHPKAFERVSLHDLLFTLEFHNNTAIYIHFARKTNFIQQINRQFILIKGDLLFKWNSILSSTFQFPGKRFTHPRYRVSFLSRIPLSFHEK